jgi:hypothetical protein
MPAILKDNEEMKSLIKNIFTYKSADGERENFVKLLREILTGEIDDVLHARDMLNVFFNKQCDTFEPVEEEVERMPDDPRYQQYKDDKLSGLRN